MISEENKVYKEMIQKGLDQRGEIERVVKEILSRTNLKNVFFKFVLERISLTTLSISPR